MACKFTPPRSGEFRDVKNLPDRECALPKVKYE